jgi:hypothetical protein
VDGVLGLPHTDGTAILLVSFLIFWNRWPSGPTTRQVSKHFSTEWVILKQSPRRRVPLQSRPALRIAGSRGCSFWAASSSSSRI